MWGGVAADPVLVSIPMFIFMGTLLERSGAAKNMLDATQLLLRGVPGGLAVTVMVIGTILAAPIGVVGASVVLLSLISLPQMLGRGYQKELAIGTIASAGTLGILIPPSIMLVVMGEMLGTSVGALFAAATMPGFVLSLLYLAYIIVVAIRDPSKTPPLPADFGPATRAAFWREMWHGLFPMTFIMVVVLGSIFAGFATATESAGVGVLGAIDCSPCTTPAHLTMMRGAIRDAARANALVFLLFLGATGFSYVFRRLGGDDMMIDALTAIGIDDEVGDPRLHHGADIPARLPVRVDRDLPDRAADLPAVAGEARFRRSSRRQDVVHAVVRDARRGEPADIVHDAALRRDACST